MQNDLVEPSGLAAGGRIVSVDVLRGFDMFWISGGNHFIAAILLLGGRPVRETLTPQLEHAAWEGFHFFDLIFPLFVFLVGISAVFSVSKIVAQSGKAAAYRRILRRAAILFFLGHIYSGGFTQLWPEIRLLGVLQRIALCYFFTALAVIHLRLRGIVVLLVLLLVGYWAWLSFVPLPGAEAISFAPGENWPNYIDAHCLPGLKAVGGWDPEGLLSTLPAVGTCLLGVLAAELLRSQKISPWGKVGWLLGGGILGVAAGYAWGLQFPVIKKIWTSSYVLVAGGYSAILLGAFYAAIDIWKLRRWALPFLWIGTNAITVYIAWVLIDFKQIAARLVGGDVQAALARQWDGATPDAPGGPLGTLLLTGAALALLLLLARFLYQRKIFLRL